MVVAPRQKSRLRVNAPLILVVDDYEDNRIMYTEYLAFAGFRVVEAADGEEAIRKAARLRPDVVVMDLSLPGIDGWEATRVIKADERTANVPVIALTGFAMATHAKRARDAGCDDFITKPCLPTDLLEALERHLRRVSRRVAAAPVRGRGRTESRSRTSSRPSRRR